MRELELTPEQKNLLKDLVYPISDQNGWVDLWKVTHMPRSYDIPATSVIPVSPPSDQELLNAMKTKMWQSIPEGASVSNPVREYEGYLELFSSGLVTMTTEQGSSVAEIKITSAGAIRLGKELVEEG